MELTKVRAKMTPLMSCRWHVFMLGMMTLTMPQMKSRSMRCKYLRRPTTCLTPNYPLKLNGREREREYSGSHKMVFFTQKTSWDTRKWNKSMQAWSGLWQGSFLFLSWCSLHHLLTSCFQCPSGLSPLYPTNNLNSSSRKTLQSILDMNVRKNSTVIPSLLVATIY